MNEVEYARRDKNILVHCAMGMSRSVAVASSLIALTKGITYEDALQIVKRKRGIKQNPVKLLSEHGSKIVNAELQRRNL